MQNSGKLILRITVGAMMLLHGISKIQHGVSFLEDMFSNMGLPAFVAYTIYIGEVLAPIALIIGYKTRIAALLVAFTMVVAIFTAHAGDIFKLGEHGSWAIELQAFYLFGALTIFMIGGGKYSVEKS